MALSLEILSQAGKKGGPAHKHKWTEDEQDIVRRDYRQTRESAQSIADNLSFITGERITLCAVKGQAQKLGILKPRPTNWTPQEDAQLADLITRYAPITIARKMRRSENAVVVRAKRLRLSRRARDGYYTKREVCDILGVDHHKAQRWINEGLLIAYPHFPGHIPQQGGMAYWHIERESLASFIRRYPQELTGRNVDLIQIVEILVGLP